MTQYSQIAETPEYTVAAEYSPVKKTNQAVQSEADLEREFIETLVSQGYEYLSITDAEGMRANLRAQMERLNGLVFTDAEWSRFFKTELASDKEGVVEKTRKFQEEPVRSFVRDDGSTVNLKIFDKRNIYRNSLQIVNQYVATGGAHPNRYDVTILANGLPIVHIELKKRGVALKEAFNQIERYQRDSFWSGDGLFEFVQIFVISNGTSTKYYSNTTRSASIKERQNKSKKKASAAFEFTSYWADASNRVIPDLVDFARTFFAKSALLNILARFCVFTADNNLLVMRPYQIAATERILRKIEIAQNYKLWTGVSGGGYVWHTTGSGKTLTSFKTARLAANMSGIDHVLFVVDRKDLDYQTMKEYDRFERGAADGNRNSKVLKRQLEDRDANGVAHRYPIIVTTIQKLQAFIKKNPGHPASQKSVVLIFDECHRSQFGDMHAAIDKFFKRRLIFGFTGTPIFAKNAPTNVGKTGLCTTEQAFGEKIHAYNIVDAIVDQNVLPFRIDYINTIKTAENVDEELIPAVDREKALLDPERLKLVVQYILQHYGKKTKQDDYYTRLIATNVEQLAKNPNAREFKESRKLRGFNSIFAVSSITAAKRYYAEFKKQLGARFGTSFKVATIFSYAPNEELADEANGFMSDENSDATDGLDADSRAFLNGAIADYNAAFNTSYDTSSEKFPNYYKDLSQRMKNREVDLLIVVSMFLTGFDAPTLNTLWVDKNLRMHGLLQAFSRTNRILNSVKTFGNIVCFRPLSKQVDETLALFGDKNSGGLVLLKTFADYYYGYEDEKGKRHPGYEELANKLLSEYPLAEPILGEQRERGFIKLFGSLLRIMNILTCFDEFEGAELLSEFQMQDYQSKYLDLHDKWRGKKELETINSDLVFEIELVKQVEVNIDYILTLVKEYCEKNREDKELGAKITAAVESSPELRPKRELVQKFVDSVSDVSDVHASWREFVRVERDADVEAIIEEEKLNPDATRDYLEKSFMLGELDPYGTELDALLPKLPLFGLAANEPSKRVAKKNAVIEKFRMIFQKYFGLF